MGRGGGRRRHRLRRLFITIFRCPDVKFLSIFKRAGICALLPVAALGKLLGLDLEDSHGACAGHDRTLEM